MRLCSSDLLSKWGFDDGASPYEWIDYSRRNGIDPVKVPFPWAEIVRRYLLPALEQRVTLAYSTNHNPIRAKTVDGVDVEGCWDDAGAPGPVLTPGYVDVRLPLADIVAIAAAAAARYDHDRQPVLPAASAPGFPAAARRRGRAGQRKQPRRRGR